MSRLTNPVRRSDLVPHVVATRARRVRPGVTACDWRALVSTWPRRLGIGLVVLWAVLFAALWALLELA
jgi:hypothetical protein